MASGDEVGVSWPALASGIPLKLGQDVSVELLGPFGQGRASSKLADEVT